MIEVSSGLRLSRDLKVKVLSGNMKIKIATRTSKAHLKKLIYQNVTLEAHRVSM
jgi:hypothetical protein